VIVLDASAAVDWLLQAAAGKKIAHSESLRHGLLG
jgi:predicted nucleic acid-binding protein